MATSYEVLGLRPGAGSDQIKSAFRSLAKQFHPDLHDGDKLAEQRFKEINEAYAILSDPNARAQYDKRLSPQRMLKRLQSVTIMAVSFALTVTLASTAVLWLRHGALAPFAVESQRTRKVAHQPDRALADREDKAIPDDDAIHNEQRPIQVTTAQQVEMPAQIAMHAEQVTAPLSRHFAKDGANWAIHRSARFGFSLRYPADIFVADPARSDEHVKWFRSSNERAVLRIFGTPNIAGRTTLAQYRTTLIQERYAKARFDYTPQRDTWFVLSGVAGDDIFYERVTFACDGRSLHGWMLAFPSSERPLYEPIIEAMHRSYQHSNGPRARCGR